jgi:hypothetical protein
MPRRFIACLCVLALSCIAAEKARPAVRVVVDTSEVPEVAEWGQQAKAVVETWYPKVSELLKSKDFTPPADVKIVFKKDMKGVAYASGKTITISADWIKKHPDDLGMVVHEMTHVVQSYRRGGPSWLVEGIADYVRFIHYEPKTRIRIDAKKASYRDSYRTSAKFLGWVEKTYDKDLVPKLNAALREGKYKETLFETYTKKTLDELWAAFIVAEERK